MSTPLLREETPVLDSKYLIGKHDTLKQQQQQQQQPSSHLLQQNENIDPNAIPKEVVTTAKPFIVASAYFKDHK